MLKLNSINKIYQSPDGELHVLKNINLTIGDGEFISIMGPSGSGKSTLLGIAAGLDKPTNGDVFLDSDNLFKMNESELSKIRQNRIGFIFQNFHLIKTLNALENVSLPLYLSNKFKNAEIQSRANELIGKVSMEHRMHHFPSQLSGGEMQRIAIARSFMNEPSLLFADEPTGNLDKKNGENVMRLLIELNKKNKSTLIVVTHDQNVANLSDKIYEMNNGEISLIK